MHCSILDKRFSELKKKLYDGKLSKPSVENFEIWLLSLKETFFDALNTSKHAQSKNFNFVSSGRGWFFHPNREDGFFPESEDLPLLEVTAKTGLW